MFLGAAMTNMLEELQNWGCNVPEALNRFLQDENLYVKCLKSFCTDESFDGLKKAIDGKEYRAAFEEAHTLKGVSANLSLTPMYEAICRVVEDLRNGPTDMLEQDYAAFEETHEKYLSLIKEKE